eukprot:CAMPEP_0196803794 /NCGR_PEP_ID=MMETSP1362-20130617/3274_1 /TAXON_ID=163516 /ORGANISM="Leptocylindrus danicus, Strain CCMP1856" /LENGTH=73 /DNA_ID=CAMNT_0042175625 /DNA_START=101 /DNA_END=322 /DNA_ORIENTATION=+
MCLDRQKCSVDGLDGVWRSDGAVLALSLLRTGNDEVPSPNNMMLHQPMPAPSTYDSTASCEHTSPSTILLAAV